MKSIKFIAALVMLTAIIMLLSIDDVNWPEREVIIYPDIAYDATIKVPHKLSRKYMTGGKNE